MPKELTVELTFAWTFTQKEWKEEKEFLENIKDNPRIILGADLYNTFHCLNDITAPKLKDIKVTNADN
jgi:hypothetical protein